MPSPMTGDGSVRLNWKARAYIVAVLATTVALLAVSLSLFADEAASVLGPEVLGFAVVTIVGEFMAVPLPRGGWLTMSTIPHVALALLFPMPVAMAISALALLVQQVYAREPWYKAGFNAASNALAVGASCVVLELAGGRPRAVLLADTWESYGALLAVAACYFALNKLLIQVVVSLASRRSLRSVVVGNGRYTIVPELGMVVTGELLALLWVSRPVWSLAIVLPALVTYRTLDYLRRLQTETEEALVALADVVDNRDPYTSHHSRRVAAHSEAIANELGLDGDEVDLIVSAAYVHDLGKIGIPDSILLKPGRLTPAEAARMQSHTGIGAEILGRFQLFRAGTALARQHHERYDGKGYPNGLAGADVSLGARIIAVADAYDAMTTDRPYRRALSQEEALAQLEAGQGSQFDPAVVRAVTRLAARNGLAAPPTEEPYLADGRRLDVTPPALPLRLASSVEECR